MRTTRNSIGALLCVLLLLVGCSFGGSSRPLEELTADGDAAQTYRINAGDTLDIQVWGEPRLSGERLVREDGILTMPLINDVQASGLTAVELAAQIGSKLDAFVPTASVVVSVTKPAPVRYFLSGSFQHPGEYRSEGQITLLQAIAKGGGFGPFADESSIVLIRETTEGQMRYKFDYNRVLDGREPNPPLKPGDTLAVK